MTFLTYADNLSLNRLFRTSSEITSRLTTGRLSPARTLSICHFRSLYTTCEGGSKYLFSSQVKVATKRATNIWGKKTQRPGTTGHITVLSPLQSSKGLLLAPPLAVFLLFCFLPSPKVVPLSLRWASKEFRRGAYFEPSQRLPPLLFFEPKTITKTSLLTSTVVAQIYRSSRSVLEP